MEEKTETADRYKMPMLEKAFELQDMLHKIRWYHHAGVDNGIEAA